VIGVTALPMTYLIYVADNPDYSDVSELYKLAELNNYDEATRVAKQVVDDYLAEAYEPGCTAQELYESYRTFGDTPLIISSVGVATRFSARKYAKQRCTDICAEARAQFVDTAGVNEIMAVSAEYEALMKRVRAKCASAEQAAPAGATRAQRPTLGRSGPRRSSR
jgi:hypothetical protein